MFIPLTPVRCLYRAVDLYGHKTGIVSGEQRYTYAEFGRRCEQLAGGLLSEGIQPGDAVAYLSFNTHKLLEGYYGPPLIRAISMPLNVRLTAPELIEILNHSGARMLLFESDFAPLIGHFRRCCPRIERYIALDRNGEGADLVYEDLLSRKRIDRPDVFSFDENEIAELFYTSGSTGSPKGVALSHRCVYLHALSVLASVGFSDADIELHTIPLFHANGWGRPQTATMNGSLQVMVRRFDPAYVLQLIQSERATQMSLVPMMAGALIMCPQIGKYDLSSMREIHIGGATSSPELIARVEAVFKCHVLSGYGLTETCPVAATSRDKSTVQYDSDAQRYERKSMAGWPIIGTEVRVVDNGMHDVPRDMETIGEVIIRGDNVMEEYFHESGATRAVLSDGWFHSGDMASWDNENYIHIVDRKKDIIISGGENISSIEVEKAIAAHPCIAECAVVAAPDEKWGEVPAAIVVLKPDSDLSETELLRFLEGRLAKFKLPKVVQFGQAPLPRTGTGKVLKRDLREPFWHGKDRRVQGI